MRQIIEYVLFNIGDFPVRIWDILDIIIVSYLVYRVYKLLRGTIGFTIFIGVLALSAVWWLVGVLDMKLLTLALGRFFAYGVLILIIVFQQEVRRFLLLLGDTTLKGRMNFLNRFFGDSEDDEQEVSPHVDTFFEVIQHLSKTKTGALVVLDRDTGSSHLNTSGVKIDAEISAPLLNNIFFKNAPLHDGAMVVNRNRIARASVILPVTKKLNISNKYGLRHRAALGISEFANVGTIIVSEETGAISYTLGGKLTMNVNDTQLKNFLKKNL